MLSKIRSATFTAFTVLISSDTFHRLQGSGPQIRRRSRGRGYRNHDSGVKQQKAAPIRIRRQVYRSAPGALEIAISQLSCLAFFSLKRSFEYTKTSAKERK
eukprot:scaffold2544_cov269-Chaetoceros_neogracile.AAC.28